jgi:hypothetical protein
VVGVGKKSTAEAEAALAAALRGLGRRLGASGSRELDRLVIAVVDLPTRQCAGTC